MTAVAVEYPSVTRDDILDGMVDALATVTPDTGDPVSDEKPFYSVARYMGELGSEEAFKRGVAGRCPAVRMAFVSDRSLRSTIGRRVDYVEGSFVAVIFSDSMRGKDDRATLLELSETVQRLLGARRLGLDISPLRHRSTAEFPAPIENCTAYGVQFATRYRVSYAVDPGDDTMDSATGEIVNNETTLSPRPHAPTLTVVGDAGTTSRTYLIIGLDADGLPTLRGDAATITDSPDVLDTDNYVHLAWPAVEGAASYQIHRTVSPADPATIGLIGTATLLVFNDTGIAASADTDPEQIHQDVETDWSP